MLSSIARILVLGHEPNFTSVRADAKAEKVEVHPRLLEDVAQVPLLQLKGRVEGVHLAAEGCEAVLKIPASADSDRDDEAALVGWALVLANVEPRLSQNAEVVA